MLKFPRKEEGKKRNGRKGKKGKKGREEGERKGERDKGTEWNGILGKEEKICKKK